MIARGSTHSIAMLLALAAMTPAPSTVVLADSDERNHADDADRIAAAEAKRARRAAKRAATLTREAIK